MDDTAFESDSSGQSHPVQVDEFGWDELFSLLGELTDEEKREFAIGWSSRMLHWIKGQLTPTAQELRALTVRTVAFLYASDMVGGATLASFADCLGVERAALSKVVTEFRKRLGYKSKNMKSDDARISYAQRASKVHARSNNITRRVVTEHKRPLAALPKRRCTPA